MAQPAWGVSQDWRGRPQPPACSLFPSLGPDLVTDWLGKGRVQRLSYQETIQTRQMKSEHSGAPQGPWNKAMPLRLLVLEHHTT